MASGYTRRLFLTAGPAALALVASDAGENFPSEAKRYPDAATEFEVVRLTDPAHTSLLPPYYSRAVSKKSNFVLYLNDRTGISQVYRMDLKTYESRALTKAAALISDSVSLSSDEHSFHFADGKTVYSGSLSHPHERPVYEAPEGFDLGAVSVAEDGTHAFVVECQPKLWRLRAFKLIGSGTVGVVESPDPISAPIPRPRRAGMLYRRGSELWLANYDGNQNHRLRVAPGRTGPAMWSADGRTVLYLNIPDDPKRLHDIREFDPDTNEDRAVADTSQYVHFGRNADGSVFVGASGSKASPYILLLVRAVKRELALCEHKASDPARVAPVFAPNSQRIFFQSDRHGKWAIYTIKVERLVEETDS